MTVEEKAAFLSGKTVWQTRDFKRLGIPSIFLSDGPHGIRKQAGSGDHLGLNASLPATCFPTAATMANSWDTELGEEVGRALGEEAASLDVDVLLGPGLNIKRSPLCGRNFEYFSEDPYLSGKMAAAYVRGIQSQGVYACPKHLAVNSQELRRMAMDSVLDERTFREIYLTGFEIAVKEGKPGAIMTSYNEINGTYANEDKHLLKEILREDWGFDGFVVTDWGASNDHAAGVSAGSELEMPAPGLDSARELLHALEEKKLTMEELDQRVDTLLDAVLNLQEQRKNRVRDFDHKKHHELARKAAGESAVLLKNDGDILPLKPGKKIAIVGDFAFDPRYQGAGSSVVNPIQVDTIENIWQKYDLDVTGILRGYERDGSEDVSWKKNVLTLVQDADVVVYCFGLNELSESEGMDRTHMRIPQNQIDLLKDICKLNENVVGVLSAGASIELPWKNCCRAILHCYLNGEAGASAVLDILTGKTNPSGRLAETYPLRYEDTPAFHNFPGAERIAQYREGLYVGYRYYDTARVRVQYPFGYGLSYTEFEYSDLKIQQDHVTFTVTNTGKMDGAEVAQLYVGLPEAEVFRPDKELKGFQKIFLKKGESRQVRIDFDDKTFRYWNVKTGKWEIEKGNYQIMIGASSADIRLTGHISRKGTEAPLPYNKTELPSYYSGLIQQTEQAEFEKLLGHPVEDRRWSGELGINDAICQMYYAKSGLARMVYRILTRMKQKSEEQGKPDLNILFIYNMPFRGLAKMTGGMVSMEMVYGIVDMVNGKSFSGFAKVIRGFFRNHRENRIYEKKLGK